MNGAIHHDGADLKMRFLKWQCLMRQALMREDMGRPNDAIIPELVQTEYDQSHNHKSQGKFISLISKDESHSLLPELRHIANKTHDPALRRQAAVQFFSAEYYQKAVEFSDKLTAVFAPQARERAHFIHEMGDWMLKFNGFGHQFNLFCRANLLSGQDYLFQASWWHNFMFNPNLQAESMILAFTPDWSKSSM